MTDHTVSHMRVSSKGRFCICGGPGNDILSGLLGNDKLDGGSGSDLCNGGLGSDTAVNCEKKLLVP
ncbi:MAG: hypothetical protein ACREQ3_00530 [Candidatus Binatia bacterium]